MLFWSQIRPVYKRQQESFDRILKCITHLIYLLVETARSEVQQRQVYECVHSLVLSNPRSATTGDTLLHLCVSRLNTIKSSYFSDDNQVGQHPLVHFIKYSGVKSILTEN